MSVLDVSLYSWSGSRDMNGNRIFNATHQVITDSSDDGPSVVLNAPGLPAIGSWWDFGNDNDPWAFCTPEAKASFRNQIEGERGYIWLVEQKFSTEIKTRRCQDEQIEDPLLEPQGVSGSFVKYTEEAMFDRFGDAIVNSAWELIRGPIVEFDKNRPTVRISQNMPSLGLSTFAGMIDCVNSAPLWGLPARCVKLSNVSWSRKIFGTCSYYYTREFEFDINYNTFDRVAMDEGNKVLNGEWNAATGAWTLLNINGAPPNKDNPTHFIRFKDKNGENTRVILNGQGEPYIAAGTSTIGSIAIEKYDEVDFLILGIPTSF